MSIEETVRAVQTPVKIVGVTKVVGPRGPAGPPGSLENDPEQVGAAVTAYMEQHTDEVLASHVNDPTPHPAYDDMPDLTLIFENGLF